MNTELQAWQSLLCRGQRRSEKARWTERHSGPGTPASRWVSEFPWLAWNKKERWLTPDGALKADKHPLSSRIIRPVQRRNNATRLAACARCRQHRGQLQQLPRSGKFLTMRSHGNHLCSIWCRIPSPFLTRCLALSHHSKSKAG